MTLRVSGKHMDIGDAFRSRIEARIGDVMGKYFDRGFSGQVTVEKQGSRFAADCNLHLASGTDIQAAGQAQDPQGAFDMAAERIENRLRRYKSKLKAHVNTAVAHEITYRVVESLPEHDHEEVAADYAPAIIAETSMALADHDGGLGGDGAGFEGRAGFCVPQRKRRAGEHGLPARRRECRLDRPRRHRRKCQNQLRNRPVLDKRTTRNGLE